MLKFNDTPSDIGSLASFYKLVSQFLQNFSVSSFREELSNFQYRFAERQ